MLTENFESHAFQAVNNLKFSSNLLEGGGSKHTKALGSLNPSQLALPPTKLMTQSIRG